jgi:NAD(P)-dependent dehydrogenase (short-subunit alcohol dehydrogenase family)
MSESLSGRTVLVIGRGSGIARAITLSVRQAGGTVVVAGRDRAALAAAYDDDPGITAAEVDLVDEASIAALAERLGHVDHVVSTASARARGTVRDLSHDTVLMSFNVKVVGPIFLAKHFAPRMPPGRSRSNWRPSGSTPSHPAPSTPEPTTVSARTRRPNCSQRVNAAAPPAASDVPRTSRTPSSSRSPTVS